MKVTLLAHTQISNQMLENLLSSNNHDLFFHDGARFGIWKNEITDGQIVSLAAIRSCYSHKTALEVLETESEKYFGDKGKESKRLFNHIVNSKHLSTFEHLNYTFAIEGVSRALLAQLTRHRHMSFSVQSQRYNKFSSDSRSGGFDYVAPDTVTNDKTTDMLVHCTSTEVPYTATELFERAMKQAQESYDLLVNAGVPQEDARSVLPNATTCNLVLTANLRTLLEFYSKRSDKAAQGEIRQLAEHIKSSIIEVEPWTEEFFQ